MWCENAATSRRGAHLQRIICQSSWNVLKLLSALVLVVTSAIGRTTRAVLIMVAYVFSGAACLRFDFLQNAGPMDGRFLAQNLEEQVACSFSNRHSDAFMLHHICIKLSF